MWLHETVVGAGVTCRLTGGWVSKTPHSHHRPLMPIVRAADSAGPGGWCSLIWILGMARAAHGVASEFREGTFPAECSETPRWKLQKAPCDFDLAVPGYHFCYRIMFLLMLKFYDFMTWILRSLPESDVGS